MSQINDSIIERGEGVISLFRRLNEALICYFLRIKERFLLLSIKDRQAILLTAGAIVLGFCFALFDPYIGISRRIFRFSLDGFLLYGVLKYLKQEEVIGDDNKKRKKRSNVGNLLLIFGSILTIVLTFFVQDVSFWLKGYRISLSLVLLGFGITGTKRFMSRKHTIFAVLFTIFFGLVETGVIFYTFINVEGKIFYDAARDKSLVLISQLKENKLILSPKEAYFIEKTHLLIVKNNYIVYTPELYDILHYFHDDPLDSLKNTFEYEWNQPALVILNDTFKFSMSYDRDNSGCKFVRGINPPISGYKTHLVFIYLQYIIPKCYNYTKEDDYWYKKEIDLTLVEMMWNKKYDIKYKKYQQNIRNNKIINSKTLP